MKNIVEMNQNEIAAVSGGLNKKEMVDLINVAGTAVGAALAGGVAVVISANRCSGKCGCCINYFAVIPLVASAVVLGFSYAATKLANRYLLEQPATPASQSAAPTTDK